MHNYEHCSREKKVENARSQKSGLPVVLAIEWRKGNLILTDEGIIRACEALRPDAEIVVRHVQVGGGSGIGKWGIVWTRPWWT